jgi:hypothetical protein
MSHSRHARIDNPRYAHVEKADSNGVMMRFEQVHPVRKVARVRLEWWQIDSLRKEFAQHSADQAANMRLRATSIERQGGAA